MKTVKTSESTTTWIGKKLGGSHTGTISLKSGSLEFIDGILTDGRFIIDMSSIEVTDLTGENKGKLEGHLKSDDFFGTINYPEAILEFKEMEQKTADTYAVTADLSIKEKTNPITFDLVVSENVATTKLIIDRSKYDVKYGSKNFFQGLGDNFIYDDFEVDVKLVY